MCQARARKKVTMGFFDNRPHTVVSGCKGQFRMKVLEDAAAEIEKDLEIKYKHKPHRIMCKEVIQIALVVKFKIEFYFPSQFYTETFEQYFSPIKKSYIQAIRKKLTNENLSIEEKENNNQAFANFLAHSPAMCTMLTRLDPHAMTQAQSEIDLRVAENQESIRRHINQLDSSSESYESRLNQLNLQLNIVADTAIAEARLNLMTKLGIDTRL